MENFLKYWPLKSGSVRIATTKNQVRKKKIGAIATSSTPADLLPQVWVAQRSDQIGDDAGAELPRHIRERQCQLQEFAWEIKRHYLNSRDPAMKNLVILCFSYKHSPLRFSLKSKSKLLAKILDYFFFAIHFRWALLSKKTLISFQSIPNVKGCTFFNWVSIVFFLVLLSTYFPSICFILQKCVQRKEKEIYVLRMLQAWTPS